MKLATLGEAQNTFKEAGVAIYGGEPATLQNTVINILRAGLSLLGVIFLVLTIYAGFMWMTAQGDDKKVTKAKDILQQAIIGLVIIVLSYAITTFVGNALTSAIK